MESLQEIVTLPSIPANSISAMFSPDGTWLAVSSAGDQIQLWHAPSFVEIERHERNAALNVEVGDSRGRQ